MRTLKVQNGDLVIAAGEFAMVEGDEELAQSVRMTMETAQGEWFLNLDFGMLRDPFENKPYNEEEIRASIIEGATDDPRITSVEELSLVFDKVARTMGVSLQLQKADGRTIEIEEVEI